MIMYINDLAREIDKKRKIEFSWGVNDCCTFVCDIVLEMTGKDAASKHRGKYKTKLEAIRSLKKNGSIIDCFDELFEEVKVINIKRGDVILHEKMALGIFFGGGVISMSEKGLIKKTKFEVIKAWSIS